MYGPPFQITLMNRKPSGIIITPPSNGCVFDPTKVDYFVIIFIDEAQAGYTTDGTNIGGRWNNDVELVNENLSDDKKCATIVFDVDAERIGINSIGFIWPSNNPQNNLPIPSSNIIETIRPNSGPNSQLAYYNMFKNTIQTKYGSDIWDSLHSEDIHVRTIVDNSGSMTYSLIAEAIEHFKSFLDSENIEHTEYAGCADERWLRWAKQGHSGFINNSFDICDCYFLNNDSAIFLWPFHIIVLTDPDSLGLWNNETRTLFKNVKYLYNNANTYEITTTNNIILMFLIPAYSGLDLTSLTLDGYGLSVGMLSDGWLYVDGFHQSIEFNAYNRPPNFNGTQPPQNIDELKTISVSIDGCTHSYTFRYIVNFIQEN